MQFKGTERYPAEVLDKAVAREGGYRNALTFLDWTTYFETLPADKVDLALDLEQALDELPPEQREVVIELPLALRELVTVRDLFYNTPARRKFLRTEKTEFGHIENLLRQLALGHFNVAFSLRHNRRETLILPVAKQRVDQERRRQRPIARRAWAAHAKSTACNRDTHA